MPKARPRQNPHAAKRTTRRLVKPEPEPKWVRETPDETEYFLLMDDVHSNPSWVQGVQLTRQEFIALKRHLAKMRGYAPKEEDVNA